MKLIHKRINSCLDCPDFHYGGMFGAFEVCHCKSLDFHFPINSGEELIEYIAKNGSLLSNCPLPDADEEEMDHEQFHGTSQ